MISDEGPDKSRYRHLTYGYFPRAFGGFLDPEKLRPPDLDWRFPLDVVENWIAATGRRCGCNQETLRSEGGRVLLFP
jgi:hypothetical protein